MPENDEKDTEISRRTLKLRVLITIQTSQDKPFSCLFLTVLFIIISLMSAMILKMYTRLVIFLNFFLLCRYVEAESSGTSTNVFSKHLSTQNKEIFNITRGHTGYRWRYVISDCRKLTLQPTQRTPKMMLYLLL